MSDFKMQVTRAAGMGLLKVKKYSPEILLGVGIVGGIGAAVLACRATLKVSKVLEDHKKNITIIEEVSAQNNTAYTHEDAMKDKAIVFTKTGLEMLKLYGPALGLGTAAIAAVLYSHGIMNRRQVAVIAAFNAVSEGFKSYRARVVEALGPEADALYRRGLKEEEYTETVIDNGKATKVTKKRVVDDGLPYRSVYARYFDDSCPNWKNDTNLNVFFLKNIQSYANDLLKIRGHIFLNEVYDMLGFPHSKEGAICGWLYNSERGDNYVDFDLYSIENQSGRTINVNGGAISIDFNVDGIIYDLI
jgi:hypothetical protein